MPIPEHAVRAIRNLPSLLKFLECDRSLNRSLPVRILCGDDDERKMVGSDLRLAS